MTKKLDEEIEIPRLSKGKSVYRRTAGSTSSDDVGTIYTINVFNPAIDVIKTDLDLRFQEHQKSLSSFHCCFRENVRHSVQAAMK